MWRIIILLTFCFVVPASADWQSRIGGGYNQSPIVVAAYVGPCDAGVGTFKVFYGVRKCATAFVGSAITIKRTSDNAVCTLSYLANGLLDVAGATPCTGSTTATAFCNATTCNITKFFDTSGALACSGSVACDYTPSTATGVFALAFNCTGSIPCLQLTGALGSASLTWTTSSTQPFTTTVVYNRTAGFTSSSAFFLANSGTNVNILATTAANTLGMYAGTATQPVTVADSSFNAATGVINGASSTWKVNSAAPATVASTPGALATGTANMRPLNGGAGATVQMMEVGFMNGAMSSGNQTTLYTNQSAFYGAVF